MLYPSLPNRSFQLDGNGVLRVSPDFNTVGFLQTLSDIMEQCLTLALVLTEKQILPRTVRRTGWRQ